MPQKSRQALKIALAGSEGRMGRAIRDLIADDKRFELSAAIGRQHDWAKVAGDVLIEFSSLAGFDQALKWCLRSRTPLVSGTTGLSPRQMQSLRRAARRIPILHSANMSLGIAVMNEMLKVFGRLEDWDFAVTEAHHSLKKDKPSGTALMLHGHLQNALGRKVPTPEAIRGGGVPGLHTIWAMGPDEVIELKHTAFNRKVFAQGALRAALWLFDKNAPGLYDLSDIYKT